MEYITVLAYLFIFIFGFFLPIAITLFAFFDILSYFTGAPYVATKNRDVIKILEKAGLRKGQIFVELGCGDGRMLRKAVEKYGVKGVGVDINPFVLYFGKLRAKYSKLTDIRFIRSNFYDFNLSDADVLYLFLFPDTLEKLIPKFLKECKKGTLFISHGFKIKGFEKFLEYKMEGKPFPTYYYRRE